MKKLFILALTLVVVMAGCGKSAKTSDKPKDATDTKAESNVSQNEIKPKQEEMPKVEEKASAKEGTNDQQKKPITDKDGNSVSGQDLQKLVEKANDPNVDEKTKREILDQIDYILKQAEN